METSEEPLCAPGEGGEEMHFGWTMRRGGEHGAQGEKSLRKRELHGGPASVTQSQMNQSIVFSVLPLA